MINWLPSVAEQLSVFSINYFIHSSVLVGLVLLAVYARLLQFDRHGLWVMKSALLMGCFTALVQTNGWLPQHNINWPVLSWQWTQPAAGHAALTKPAATPAEPEPMRPPTITAVDREPQWKVSQTPHQTVSQDNSQSPPANDQAAEYWLAMWLSGLLVLTLRQLRCQRRWQQLMADRTAVTDPAIKSLFTRLLRTGGLSKDVALSQSDWLTSPVAWRREVICPTAFLQRSSADQIEAALAHELAHIKNKDGRWLSLSQWLQLLLFFQPLNRLLTQHIHQATEQQADQLATAWTANPRALAVTLVDVAQAQQPRIQPQMVPAMSTRKSQLLQRVENIMQPTQSRTNRLLSTALLGAVMMIIASAPGVVAQSSWLAVQHAKGSTYHNISMDGGTTDISLSSSTEQRTLKLKASLAGELVFNDDESAILDFPTNSRFDLTHTEDGIKRRIKIVSAPGVNQEQAAYTYWYEGDEQAFDAPAREWFAGVIPMMFRETGLQAEARVERIHRNRGASAVLDEVAQIDSDFVSKNYLTHLFDLTQLSDDMLERAMTLAAGIGSDFELSHVLSTLVETQELDSEDLWLSYFATTAEIGSDFEMAKTMLNVLPELPQTEAINQAYFTAAESIGSDFEMAKVLIAYLQRNADQAVNMGHLFELAADIGSDFELAKVMLAANRHIDQSNATDQLFSAYLQLASHIGSDFEMKKVYADLLKHELAEHHLRQMIDSAAEHIGSDFELATLLLSITEQRHINAELKARIKAAARTIGSQYERNRVLAAVS